MGGELARFVFLPEGTVGVAMDVPPATCEGRSVYVEEPAETETETLEEPLELPGDVDADLVLGTAGRSRLRCLVDVAPDTGAVRSRLVIVAER